MVDKALIFNITLDALGLGYQTTDPDNDSNPNVKKIMLKYRLGLKKALADMDLQQTSTKVKLEKLAKNHVHWDFVYKYPNKCVRFRKIVSPFPVDNKETLVPSATENIDKIKVVLTNQDEAYAEIIPEDINLDMLSPSAAMAVGNSIASLCGNLIVGSKGKDKVRKEILDAYRFYKAEAQAYDSDENVDYTPDEYKSSFVMARLGRDVVWPRRR